MFIHSQTERIPLSCEFFIYLTDRKNLHTAAKEKPYAFAATDYVLTLKVYLFRFTYSISLKNT
ncbi:hypothetical protein DRF59_16670 [Chryseobacterium flavum]|uniref:Uncharacterized protein n=1 Tax=Chryseobacterium flavum TaxID=415851 RepID=A0A3D9CHW4_9FLAO|nr:hypothetical protein DRF59_16670 [Chryseobacterium flavum]